jgi:hypothetical protein
MNEELIAYVWSFRDASDIPYRIMRKGTPKREGGNGAKYSCNCPHFVNRGKTTCKHLKTLIDEAKTGALLHNSHYNLSDFGKKVLKLG